MAVRKEGCSVNAGFLVEELFCLPKFAHVSYVGGDVGFDQVLGSTNIKLSITFAFDLVDYHCSFVSLLVDAGAVDFVRILTVARFGGSYFIEDAFHHFLMGVRE